MDVNNDKPKYLAAFDFDHTIVEENTDIIVRDLLDPILITNEITQISKKAGWTFYMDAVFRLLHDQNIKKELIRKAITNMKEVDGIAACIKTMKTLNFDIIIISDSNSEFIDTWLKHQKLYNDVDRVFTNPAKFNYRERLEIQPYHTQKDCRLSSINLCKGMILESYINERFIKSHVRYDRVMYCGDGKNDICPMGRLPKNGLACVRRGFYCDREIEKYIAQHSIKFKAQIARWKDGNELITLVHDKFIAKHDSK